MGSEEVKLRLEGEGTLPNVVPIAFGENAHIYDKNHIYNFNIKSYYLLKTTLGGNAMMISNEMISNEMIFNAGIAIIVFTILAAAVAIPMFFVIGNQLKRHLETTYGKLNQNKNSEV